MAALRLGRATPALLSTLAIALLCPSAVHAAITEFPLPPQRAPSAIVAGPDGALGFTEQGNGLGAGNGAVARITTAGTVTRFAVPTPNSLLGGLAVGPDGALWFTEPFPRRIGRVTTGGSFSRFPVSSFGLLNGITAGPDGALWFTADGQVGRITTAGAVTLFSLGGGDAQVDITAGPDGALWFTEQSANRIGRITTSGGVTHFPVPTPGSLPENITVGPDGALWFTEFSANKIGRVTTAGSFTEFPIPTPGSGPGAITTGPDGALWFVESFAGKIGRITTSGVVTDFRVSGLPRDIVAGPDGALWFTLWTTDRIGRITTDQPREDAVDGLVFTEPPCGEIGCTPPRYTFRVASGPSGEGPRGSVVYTVGERLGEASQNGSVTCLRVEGDRAAIGVEFAASADGRLEARAALIVVRDGGNAPADRLFVQNLPVGSAPTACPAPGGVTLGPAFGGPSDPGVVVVDVQRAPSGPTSKDQCKRGGWRAFGFRNQGQCVAFVNHRPKP